MTNTISRNIYRTFTSITTPYRSHHPKGPKEPTVHSFFHNGTSTFSYVVVGAPSDAECQLEAIIIDPVLDFDLASGRVSHEFADELLFFATSQGLKVKAVLETHAHADHLSAGKYLTENLPKDQDNKSVPLGIGKGIKEVQRRFASRYGMTEDAYRGAFDLLLKQGDSIPFGSSTVQVLELPGHTPDHIGYRIGDNVFTGDVIFLPDVGSARADFPGGNTETLQRSIQSLMALPAHTRIYVAHDYPPKHNDSNRSRNPSCFSTVGEQKASNIHLKDWKSFAQWRKGRDFSLGTPKLLHPSLQVNICGGKLPKAERNGISYIRIPLSSDGT